MSPTPFEFISTQAYKQARQIPPLGHPHYLHLSDLLLALESAAQHPQGTWLDYGCGASPYQFLFENCGYQRADIKGENLDYVITPGKPLDAPDAAFDGILSTQVLEHVLEPAAYLADCWRMLKPGGRLILSTHGIWKEHGAPYDYHRWTEWGLRAAVEQAGFANAKLARVTCGPRVLLTLLNAPELAPQFQSGVFGKTADLILKWLAGQKKRLHQLSDNIHGNYRVVWDKQEVYYLVLLINAEKPQPA